MSDAPLPPLAGKHIVNTRATHQAAALSDLLRAHGADPLAYPCITVAPPADSTVLDAALAALAAGRFDWLLLTSANTVVALAQRLDALSLTLPRESFACAAVGPATADAARTLLGLEAAHLPASYSAAALAETLPLARGARVLLPESALARPTLAADLGVRGALVTVVDAYMTVCAATGGVDLPALCAAGTVDALTFTSSSTVACFLRRFRSEGGDDRHLRRLVIACIGAATADTARSSGLAVDVLPAASTLAGLVDALASHFAARPDAPLESP